MKKLVVAFAVIIVVLLGILFFYNPVRGPIVPGGIGNNSSTGAQPIMSPDGHVAVTVPVANQAISSPVVVQGTVTGGGWFFEATFPVEVLDANGNVIGQGPAQAQGDWTSTGTIPFSASITFIAPVTATGTIVLSKDNPSASPVNHNDLFSIPVRF